MKRFDDILRESVANAFSSYNADHLADKGWNSFVAARKGKGRLRVIPLWFRAASIALIIGTGALVLYLIINRPLTEETQTAKETGPAIEIRVAPQTEPLDQISPVITAEVAPGTGKEEKGYRISLREEQVSEDSVLITDIQQTISRLNKDTSELTMLAESRLLPVSDSLNQAVEAALKEFLEDEPAETGPEEQEKRSGRTSVMAGVSGLLAQVRDAASTAPGVSFGFYLEQKITDRISLRPGLALAINSVGVDSRSDSYNEFAYSVPLYSGNSGTLDSYNGQLSMLAMELPLNVVFKVFEKGRSNLFLSAGASTMVYFSQQFSGDFVNEYTQKQLNTATGLMDSETRYSTIAVENSYGAFSRTDYFGLANLSAGYSLPYGKAGTLLIEPFMQLPLSDLTALNLRVRYGGISMKLRFGTQNSDK